jgi:4-alpha-glucanotransferase
MQWHDLKTYANAKGIQIIGDLPYYTAFESADCWSNPALFQLDESGGCKFEAGAPPDAFTAEGQCWGNPVYDWNAHKMQNYKWWISRIRQQLRFFDVLRIDHMRGFESYYVIPADTEDPKEGHWEKGPGMELFHAVHADLGECKFIAEDLGYLTQEVKDMMSEAGYPGMKILQFAFDTSEENVYLPFNYDTNNAVIYTGTHDNDTTAGWYASLSEEEKRMVTLYIRTYYGIRDTEHAPEFGAYAACEHLVEMAQQSRAPICIIPIQDYLRLGSEARINVPGTAEGNWAWRVQSEALDADLAAHVHRITVRSGRLNRRG